MDKLNTSSSGSNAARNGVAAEEEVGSRARGRGFDVRPIRAEVERLEQITVCTRPFRPAGPRIEAERIGEKRVIHNYGHGGSGWSLSWGSAARVVPLALAGGAAQVAVIGCGALGLTAAISLQRAGAKVTIHARDLPPEVRSSRATGLWSPDSRVARAASTDAEFAESWERMARETWRMFGRALELPGRPIEFHDRYLLSELPPDEEIAERYREDRIGFAHLEHRLRGLYAPAADFGPGEHPFPTAYCRKLSTLRFNITEYTQALMAEFRERGGKMLRAMFQSPAEFGGIPEQVVVNCTGYGARALFGDESLVPVRGQIGWLPAQPELRYSLLWKRLSVVPRADGVVVQVGASSDDTGWSEDDEEPRRTESEDAVRRLAELQRRTRFDEIAVSANG